MTKQKRFLFYGPWRLRAINKIPSTIAPEILGYAIKKINCAALNDDGTITIRSVLDTRTQAEKIGYEVARDAVFGLNWKEVFILL